jgi:cysteine-rich repeat protein
VEAGIRIVRDDVGVPSSTGRIIKGSQTAQVLLCENPWPARGNSPFSESSGHPSLAILSGDWGVLRALRSIGPWFNFSTLYCRDAGERGIGGDLPELQAQVVAVSDADLSLGILRQYLFTFGAAYPALRGDGIGIRVAANPLHLSPRAWYASRGFTGEPEALTVDGYEAVKAGTTWYVGGTNTADATSAPVYSQIYIISYNPDAKAETKSIVGQLVDNFTLNANLQSGSSNACVFAAAGGGHYVGELSRGADGQVVRCTADWECLANDRRTRCSSFKAKVQRDSKRIVDFQFMTDSLEGSHERSGSYPQLQAGTFVPTMSTSRWPSWSAQLQGETGVAFPSDPVNRFLSCGFCSGSGSPCQDSSECAAGQTCAAAAGREGAEPSTCWNPTSRQYQCPQLTGGVPESVSRLYQYRSVNAGTRYELSTELEGAAATRYDPPLLTEIKKCSNLDVICSEDSDCEVINALTRAVVSSGRCSATGGTWRYNAVCTSSVYGAGSGVCGDGVIGSGEVCEMGDTNPEVCHVPGTPGVADNGTQLRICNDCRSWSVGPATRCVLTLQCGNGRVDAGETCDDGALNGSYGHCSRSCGGYDSFCGDSRMSPGETCDLGTNNGAYCRSGCDAAASCNLSCTGPGPRCGDGEVNGLDQCDGNAERTTSAICVGGSNHDGLCVSNSDCPSGGVCGPAGSAAVSCAGVTARRCSNGTHPACAVDTDCGAGNRCLTYPTSHTRACRDYGTPLPTVPGNWCKWKPWSGCEPTSYCGDGIVDSGEDCDDGNASNNDACTNACRPNTCGDSFYYPGVEECDLGADNGRRTCTADYGSSCLSCSSSCRQVASSGGYCGNDVREGSEQCDGTQGLGTCSGDSTRSCLVNADCTSGTCNLISCRSLGFDYAQSMTCQNYAFVRDGGRVVCTSREICWLSLPALLTTGVLIPAGSVTTTLAEAPRVCNPGTIRDTLSCASSCSLAGCARCGDSPGTGTISGQVLDAVNYVYPVPNARVTLYNRGVPVAGGQAVTNNDGRFTISALDNNSACVSYRIVVDFYQDNPCTGPMTGRPAGMTCNGLNWNDSLGVSDESVNGGYWPYESATFGVSTFQSRGLNSDTNKIYLVPRVGVDETVAVTTFRGSNTTFLTYLELPIDQAYKADNTTPAPEDMALCALSAKDGHEPNYGYPSDRTCVNNNDCTVTAASGGRATGLCLRSGGRNLCSYPMCQRTLFWNAQGNQNLSVTPHSEIVCRNISGASVTAGCYTARAAPYVARFKKGPWNRSGFYSYWLVDQSSGAAPSSWRYFTAASATVTIVTNDRIYKVTPPTTAPTCAPPLTAPIPNSQRPITLFPGPPAWTAPAWCGNIATESTNGVGKNWLVFQENAVTGDIILNNQLLCRNSSIPNEPSSFDAASPLPYPLPWPLIWSDCHYAVPR